MWACEHWKGGLYKKSAPRAEWLPQYSEVFNTVEGNSTFYALPSLDTARRWSGSVRPGFRFALKVPRSISHESWLRDCNSELAAFLKVAQILRADDHLGPSFVQLPPDFGPSQKSKLEFFLKDTLPSEFPWAVEVRHMGWFDETEHEPWLDDLLRELKMDKVLFDSRALNSKPATDATEKESQRRKPKTPLRNNATGQHPFLRFIGRNQLDEVKPWIDYWAGVIAGWINDGLEPFVFTHAPDDAYAPEFARRMHQAIGSHCENLPALPVWPGEKQAEPPQQLMLF